MKTQEEIGGGVPSAVEMHSHRADDGSLFSETKTQDATALTFRASTATRPPPPSILQAHPARGIKGRFQAHAWTGRCWPEKSLPEPSPAGHNIMGSGSASCGRF